MLKSIYELGIIPVVKIDDASLAVGLAKALIDGDLPVVEVTFRTKAAKDAIRNIAKEFPDMIVCAGTVLNTSQVDDAIEAGAQFIVSPGFNPKVVEYCVNNKIIIIPGLNNPSAIEAALEFGLEVVKFFPAEASGGLKALKAISGPYGNVKFMPTGGVDLSNLEEYLAFDKIVACGGTWMVPGDALAKKDFATITKLAKQAVQTVLGFKYLHLGINNNDAKEAENACSKLENLFGYSCTNDLESAKFMGTDFEVLKKISRGNKGHIGFSTNNMDRAIAYMKRKGINIVEDTIKRDSKGKIKLVHLDLDISGFAVHITQK